MSSNYYHEKQIENAVINYIDDVVCKNKKLHNALETSMSTINRVACNVSSLFETSRDYNFNFKRLNSYQERVEIFNAIVSNNPDKIPIIIESYDDDKSRKPIKLLLSYDEMIIRLIAKIRSSRQLPFKNSMFILTDNNRSITGSQTVGEVYKDYLYEKSKNDKECDRILYLMIFEETTFG